MLSKVRDDDDNDDDDDDDGDDDDGDDDDGGGDGDDDQNSMKTKWSGASPNDGAFPAGGKEEIFKSRSLN